MQPIFSARWLQAPLSLRESPEEFRTGACPDHPVPAAHEAPVEFLFSFTPKGAVRSASLQATALGVYTARLGGQKIGGEVLAPGWTNYRKRLQYQTYDVTALVRGGENLLSAEVGLGWRMHAREKDWMQPTLGGKDTAFLAALTLVYEDGTKETLKTGEGWLCRASKTRYSNIYNGEVYDAGFDPGEAVPAPVLHYPKEILIPRQGERITEQERLPVQKMFTTPEGELVLDFGQVLTGYVSFRIEGPAGAKATLRHAEILDAAGNFYTENLRQAREEIVFLCDGGTHTFQPRFTFQGFRYVQPKDWPCEVRPEDFTAVVVHSEMRRTGYFECSNPLLNRLFENIVWGQKGNFLDIPTDCPQRDERLGWTGDAQAFVRTASYLFDTETFFTKWLADLASEQFASGGIPHVIPRMHWDGDSSTGWADAAVICPWQIYLTYGDREILRRQFDSMKGWVDYMIARAEDGLWLGGDHFGDWLFLEDERTPNEWLQNAYFAYSTSLLVKAGEVLGVPVEDYRAQRRRTEEAMRQRFLREGKLTCNTQTACAQALYFGLVEGEDRVSVAAQLAQLVREAGHLRTGFLGTPYLLHALSENGYTQLAYDLLLRTEYPSWLYPVTRGATTVWERWDGQRPDGSFQSKGMNSFNHYAYGAVGDWLFGGAAGIRTDESQPGFTHIRFAPLTDSRLDYVSARIETRHGTVASAWKREGGLILYTFEVPEGCTATADIGGTVYQFGPGVKTVSRE
ncbi:MAG: glycoside hydrolase family 78 protein [Oscillospiraceae bacterium]|jgi:alpha-L-rhamnosidase|nr:glycoside hydrolase family 78 protein [Oscillospiraceae bacterium]